MCLVMCIDRQNALAYGFSPIYESILGYKQCQYIEIYIYVCNVFCTDTISTNIIHGVSGSSVYNNVWYIDCISSVLHKRKKPIPREYTLRNDI